ncbi:MULTISPECIES: MarR family winged helix-turn-helix transcriptional regulator [Brucella]|jgi:DNA-binding MarR family transcriptional regulator|uniref:Winged helix DNA-binding domain protein n=1 Tax=Brucella pseudogrignonensis TaxID=419475 RepID=A0A1A9FT00_9HYPH|nr:MULTISPECIES: MarR family transcriptional regulator [Brucella]MBO1026437.1 MarR family transcriptional regulator [Ochrobactrum sp. SD129]MQP40545.1 MarR family transcriptional regulator [Ochrobactrum sp. MYb237]ANG98979.1 MarR family transcriptional regulator [Brucella pseudogrignonensis]OYR22536.1 winged helix DNA-binding domain protein [Brucella pseudogrignonensis]PQZ38932.1 MarR family transcriptional regulator [Brucella pseudogrignonensis]
MDRAKFAATQWANELPDLKTGPMVLLGRLGETALVITRDRVNPLLEKFGLQPGEFDVLATLRRSGAPYALTPTDLYEVAMISSGSMTNRLDRLEKSGFIERRPNPNDKRGSIVALTASGRRVIESAILSHVDNLAAIVQGLSDDEQAALSTLLEKLLASQLNQP